MRMRPNQSPQRSRPSRSGCNLRSGKADTLASPIAAMVTRSLHNIMRKFIHFLPVFAAVMVTGCFPMRIATSPGAHGTIVDAQTSRPIQGAEIFRSTARYSFHVFTNQTLEGVTEEAKTAPPPQPPLINAAISNVYPPVIFTDANGRFAIPPTKKWILYIVPMDIFPAYSTLVIRADGYQSELRHVVTHSSADVGIVPLASIK